MLVSGFDCYNVVAFRLRLQIFATDDLDVNVVAIEDRLRDMEQKVRSTKYDRKCSSLDMTFTQFLASCSHSPNLSIALSDDIRLFFLIWKDTCGKTKVHYIDCQFIWDYEITASSCPLRLSAGTVEGIIQQFKTIFVALGEWGCV